MRTRRDTGDETRHDSRPSRSRSTPSTASQLPGAAQAIRIIVSVFAAINLVDAVHLVGAWDEQPLDWRRLVSLCVGYLAMGLAPWLPTVGAIAGIVPLAIALAVPGGTGVEPVVIATCTIALAIRPPRWRLWLATSLYVAWTAAFAILVDDANLGWALGCILFVSLVVGLAVRHFATARIAARRRVAELEAENTKIRSDERELLARELHDVVAHELSIISLQVMGHGDADDSDELRTAMAKIDQASKAALTELRALVGILREVPNAAATPLTGLDVHRVHDTAAQVEQTLKAHGFDPRIQLTFDPSQFDPSLQNTVSRILQEASTNILRYAKPGSACAFSVATDVTHVTVKAESVIDSTGNASLAWQSSGWGLRGLKERVQLSGGTLAAGARDDTWIVEAAIPRH